MEIKRKVTSAPWSGQETAERQSAERKKSGTKIQGEGEESGENAAGFLAKGEVGEPDGGVDGSGTIGLRVQRSSDGRFIVGRGAGRTDEHADGAD